MMTSKACLNPIAFPALVPKVMKLDRKKEGGKSFGGIIVEQVDENGTMKKLDL